MQVSLRESFNSLYEECIELPLPSPISISPKLKDSIESMYSVFSIYEKPLEIDYCPCCISKEQLQSLLDLPLRDLMPRNLYGYISSVFLTAGYVEDGFIEDFKYFLPRILELMIYYWESLIFYPSPWRILDRLKMSGWESWELAEKNIILELLDSISEELITSTEINADKIGDWIEALTYCFEDESKVFSYISALKEPEFNKKLIEFCQFCYKRKLIDTNSFDEFTEILCKEVAITS